MTHTDPWQAYLDSEAERATVYQRLAQVEPHPLQPHPFRNQVIAFQSPKDISIIVQSGAQVSLSYPFDETSAATIRGLPLKITVDLESPLPVEKRDLGAFQCIEHLISLE